MPTEAKRDWVKEKKRSTAVTAAKRVDFERVRTREEASPSTAEEVNQRGRKLTVAVQLKGSPTKGTGGSLRMQRP